MINRANKAGPQAIRLLTQAMHDTELSMSLRCRCAEFIVDRIWPKGPAAAELHLSGGGIDFLELRFVTPGQPSTAADTITLPLQPTHRIAFDPATDVEGNEPSDGG